jgi:Mrp family chromosome partitioning ATPase
LCGVFGNFCFNINDCIFDLEENPMIWRGPMVTQALEQMLRDTLWRGVDYMIMGMSLMPCLVV